VVVVVGAGFVVVVVGAGFVVVVVGTGAVVVVDAGSVVVAVEVDVLKGVSLDDVAPAFTRYQAPAPLARPSPPCSRDSRSPAYVYTGYELYVTCFIFIPLATKPTVPLTPVPSVIVVTEFFTRSGSHVERHASRHFTAAPFSEVNKYSDFEVLVANALA
jgi:hypothetical protein